MKAKISEIFSSIQGEGLYQGRAQVFVRFFGCNLSCDYCDTPLENFREFSVDQLLREVEKAGCSDSVSITGGEPLYQAAFLEDFLPLLKGKGKSVYLETNGVLYQALSRVIDWVDIIAMDFKLPSSTGGKEYWLQHREFLKISCRKEVFVKVVIGPGTLSEDVQITGEIIREINKKIVLILQPQNPYEKQLEGKLRFLRSACERLGLKALIIAQKHKQLGIR
jgi:7-carboxy-7-deazaguanine synthase